MYTPKEMNAAMQGRANRLDGGSIVLLDAHGGLICSATLGTPCAVVSGAAMVVSGVPIECAMSKYGAPIATAATRRRDGSYVGVGYTVGLEGSGADVIVDGLLPLAGQGVCIKSFSVTDTQ